MRRRSVQEPEAGSEPENAPADPGVSVTVTAVDGQDAPASEPEPEPEPEPQTAPATAERVGKKRLEYGKTAYRVRCTSKVIGMLFDPDRQIHIPRYTKAPVEVAGPVREGSWLYTQLKANNIEIIG